VPLHTRTHARSLLARQVWKAAGMNLENVEFLSSSEEINKRPDEYWTLVMDIARKNNLKRILRRGRGAGVRACLLRRRAHVFEQALCPSSPSPVPAQSQPSSAQFSQCVLPLCPSVCLPGRVSPHNPPCALTSLRRCSQIMGRSETEDLSAAQVFYPCMQCADVFFLRADICQLGMDQRKVRALCGGHLQW